MDVTIMALFSLYLSNLISCRDIIMDAFMSEKDFQKHYPENGVNLDSLTIKNRTFDCIEQYKMAEHKILNSEDEEGWSLKFQTEDLTKPTKDRKTHYIESLKHFERLENLYPPYEFANDYKIYSLIGYNTVNNLNLISDVFEALKNYLCPVHHFKLMVFSIPNISSLKKLNDSIKFQSFKIKNEFLVDKFEEYKNNIEDINIECRIIKLKMVEDLQVLINNENQTYNEVSKHYNFFIFRTHDEYITNSLEYVLESFFYDQISNINKSKVFIVKNVMSNENCKYYKKNYLNDETIYDDSQFFKKLISFCNNENSQNISINELNCFVEKKKIALRNAAFLTKIKEYNQNINVVDKHDICPKKTIDLKTLYRISNDVLITIYQSNVIHLKCEDCIVKQHDNILKFETRFDTFFIKYKYRLTCDDEDKQIVKYILYNDINVESAVISYNLNDNHGDEPKDNKYRETHYIKNPKALITNLINNCLAINNSSYFRLQNFHESLIFDEFLFNAAFIAYFNHSVKLTNRLCDEEIFGNYKNYLIANLPDCNIKIERITFSIGSKQHNKIVHNVSPSKNCFKNFGDEIVLNSKDTILDFIQNHCTNFAIVSEGTKLITSESDFLYSDIQIMYFTILNEQKKDSFYVLFVSREDFFKGFVKRLELLLQNIFTMKAIYEVAVNNHIYQRVLFFEYSVGDKKYTKEIDLLYKHKNDVYLITELWNEFIRLAKKEINYIILDNKYSEYLEEYFYGYECVLSVPDPNNNNKKIKVKGYFTNLVECLSSTFKMIGEIILTNVREKCNQCENKNEQVMFISENCSADNFLKYLNCYVEFKKI